MVIFLIVWGALLIYYMIGILTHVLLYSYLWKHLKDGTKNINRLWEVTGNLTPAKSMLLWPLVLFRIAFKNCWLCIRYPFLYSKEKERKYLLTKPTLYFYRKSVIEIVINGKQEKENNRWFMPILRFFDFKVRLDKETRKLYITKGRTTVEQDLNKLTGVYENFNILGISLSWSASGFPIINVHFKNKDEKDEANYMFRAIRIGFINNKFLHYIYKRLEWWDNCLDFILFIPNHTELDAMPEGWRIAFGVDMCEEIRKVLVKHKLLHKYKIVQIKQKFGGLRWYDEDAPKEVEDIISKYERKSYNTCIACGDPATKRTTGYVLPYCDRCFSKIEER